MRRENEFRGSVRSSFFMLFSSLNYSRRATAHRGGEAAGGKTERRRAAHRDRKTDRQTGRRDGVTDRKRVGQWAKRNEGDRMGFTAPICQGWFAR